MPLFGPTFCWGLHKNYELIYWALLLTKTVCPSHFAFIHKEYVASLIGLGSSHYILFGQRGPPTRCYRKIMPTRKKIDISLYLNLEIRPTDLLVLPIE